ncbi:MAG: SprT-like domain-containing protein [Nanobdellota archaeon]
MDICERAYFELFGKPGMYNFTLKYSGKFNGYNGNVKKLGKKISFSLSRKWQDIDEEIQLGILQSLLCKLFKVNIMTSNIEMYNNFLKNVHIALEKKESDPELEESFERVNEWFFHSTMEISRLKWSRKAKRCFGTYEYGTDIIRINPILSKKPELLDFVMYHEMLHKKYKFNVKNNRSFHHTREFKEAENRFPRKRELEKELAELSRKKP